ncbi:MAG: hypothetical protein ACYC9R_06255 [Nitrosotalea sp.]
MHSNIAKRWITALTSGKYKQCRGELAIVKWDGTFKSFCCLGVLTDLYCKEKKTHEDMFNGLPSFEVMNWAGMKTREGSYISKKGPRDLTMDNDQAKRGFKKIAEIIAKHVKEL